MKRLGETKRKRDWYNYKLKNVKCIFKRLGMHVQIFISISSWKKLWQCGKIFNIWITVSALLLLEDRMQIEERVQREEADKERKNEKKMERKVWSQHGWLNNKAYGTYLLDRCQAHAPRKVVNNDYYQLHEHRLALIVWRNVLVLRLVNNEESLKDFRDQWW